jgi:hypothetical protein
MSEKSWREKLASFNRENFSRQKPEYYDEPKKHVNDNGTEYWTCVVHSPPDYKGWEATGDSKKDSEQNAAMMVVEAWDNEDQAHEPAPPAPPRPKLAVPMSSSSSSSTELPAPNVPVEAGGPALPVPKISPPPLPPPPSPEPKDIAEKK